MSKQTYKHTNKQKLDKGSEIVLYTCQPLTYADSVCVCVGVCVCVYIPLTYADRGEGLG
jgi:hypothetical protein